MNRIFALLFFCFIWLEPVRAQIHEVGVFAGGSNFIGDVGATDYISPNEPAFGILYKWNRSPRHSWRISYVQSKLSANDGDADSQARNLRNYSFKNDLKELSLGLEFNFFDFNLHDGKRKITPYVYSGLSGFMFDEMYFENGETQIGSRKSSLAIPMVVGIKANVTDHWVLGVEAGARWTFTDNLDGSHPSGDHLEAARFGNINNKDWYVFTGITLTYTFGNKPCYCAE